MLFLSFRISKMSLAAAQTTFWGYAALMGVVAGLDLDRLYRRQRGDDLLRHRGTFGAMSLWGYTTQRDLTGFGSFLFMGLIGIMIASLVNFFFQSGHADFVISVAGVLIFTGLTAYDTQKIKNNYVGGDDGAMAGKTAIMGALSLYLDFLNIFLFLLRFMGNRR